jgi:hypothetical protein
MDLFPPGIDLCEVGAGIPPNNATAKLHEAPELGPALVTVSVIMLTSSVVFIMARLLVSLRSMTLADCKHVQAEAGKRDSAAD